MAGKLYLDSATLEEIILFPLVHAVQRLFISIKTLEYVLRVQVLVNCSCCKPALGTILNKNHKQEG
jgi:hypothetical protein